MAWFRRGGLRAGRPVVCRMARKLPDRGTQFLSRLDRLESHLNQADDLDQKVKSALPGLWLPLVRDDTPIILGKMGTVTYFLAVSFRSS
jgi:hypothetical protein